MRGPCFLASMLALAAPPDSPKEQLPVRDFATMEAAVVALRAPGSSTVSIPGGSFTMGSSATEVEQVLAACKREPIRGLAALPPCVERTFEVEREAHQVTLQAFRIDRREVSVEGYERCVEAGRCLRPPYDQGGERFSRPDFPVSLVSWEDASRYCRFVGGRLPTEAEWERAARGRLGRLYPWGQVFDPRRANHGASLLERHDGVDGFLELAEVGSFPEGRTPDGIDDLAGNVAEWVADAFEEGENVVYEPREAIDPLRTVGNYRVIRGGGYRSPAFMLRTTARHFVPKSTRAPDIGFRCAYAPH